MIDKIRKSLEAYNQVTGLAVLMIDNEGNEVMSVGSFPKFCSDFEKLTGGKMPCAEAHLRSGVQAGQLGEAYIYFCPGGLVHWTAPIYSKIGHAGSLVSGMVQMDIADDYIIENLIKSHALTGESQAIMVENLKHVRIVDTPKVRYLADMLSIIAQNISYNKDNFAKSERMSDYESWHFNENLYLEKEKRAGNIEVHYPINIEQDLINFVKSGNKKGAKELINNILGYIFYQYAGNVEIMIARGLELLVIISRASIEGGADPKRIFELTNYYMGEIPTVKTVDQLSFLIIKVLDQFTDSVFPDEAPESALVIKTAIEYIDKNFAGNITLADVADRVFLSHAYFSRLFKSETGMTFSEYVNYVRIEKSKKYLLNLEYSISEVAAAAGFSDQSYFTKVFKKMEGISPGKYRKNR